MKLDVKKDRIEINKIIENILPLMIKNKNLTQECADCIIVYFIEKIDNQQKKDDEAIPVSHLETRSSMEEDNTWDCKTNDVDNHADTDDLTKIGLVPTSRIEGHRENPQDDSGVETSSAKEDNGNGTFPADSKSKIVILDDNELSLSLYAQEYPENFKAMTETKQDLKDSNCDVT